jgi:hypothetical protein
MSFNEINQWEAFPKILLWASKRDKIMNTHTIKSNACKHYESSHM